MQNTRQKMKYKYTLNDQINSLPREIKISDILKILEKEGISQDSFYRDRNIRQGSDQSIPTDRLFIYADLFDCDVHDLFPRNKRTSIRTRLARVAEKYSVKRTGLKRSSP